MRDFLRQRQQTDSNIAINWHIYNLGCLKTDRCFGYSKKRSNLFLFQNLTWRVEIYPRGTLASRGWVHFNIRVSDRNIESEGEIPVEYTIGFKKTDGSVYKSVEGKHTFHKNSIRCRVAKFVECSQYLSDGEVKPHNGPLVVFCTLRHLGHRPKEIPEIPLAKCTSLDTLSKNLKHFLFEGRYSDVKIKVGNHQFKSHMSILAARSPVFDSMFRHDMSEKRTGVIDITDCNPDTFKDFLIFMYAGDLDFESCSNVLDLYKTAEKYDVKDLTNRCTIFLRCKLSTDIICDVISLAVTYNESTLLEASTKYFLEKVDEILPTPKWKAFSKDNHLFANELMIKVVNRFKRKLQEDDDTNKVGPVFKNPHLFRLEDTDGSDDDERFDGNVTDESIN